MNGATETIRRLGGVDAMREREENVPAGYHVIYVKWITRKGVKVYPPNGLKVWRLVVRDKRADN